MGGHEWFEPTRLGNDDELDLALQQFLVARRAVELRQVDEVEAAFNTAGAHLRRALASEEWTEGGEDFEPGVYGGTEFQSFVESTTFRRQRPTKDQFDHALNRLDLLIKQLRRAQDHAPQGIESRIATSCDEVAWVLGGLLYLPEE